MLLLKTLLGFKKRKRKNGKKRKQSESNKYKKNQNFQILQGKKPKA